MPSTPDAPVSRWWELALASTLLVVCLGLGAATGLLADRTLPSILVLLAEPLAWFALLVTAGAAWVSEPRRLLIVGSALGSLLLSATLVRLPDSLPAPPSPSADVPREVRRAVRDLDLPVTVVRIATWNAGGQPASKAPLDGLDLLVAQDSRSSSHEPEGGRILFAPTGQDRGLSLVIPEGRFSSLGDRGTWLRFNLAAGSAVFTVAELPQGQLPVLALDLDPPQSVRQSIPWPARLQASAEELSAIAHALGSPGLTMLGDTSTHDTFRHALRTLGSTSLSPAPARPTWPARWLGLPAPSLYRPQRAWLGRAWTLKHQHTERWSGSHHALVLDLGPRRGQD